jgi:hypothetical protein
MRAALVAALLALTACATLPEPPRTTLIANRLIIPRDCRAEEQDWRDARAQLAADPENAPSMVDEAETRHRLALCIAPSIREA